MESQDVQPPLFWQAAVIRLLRIAVHLALKSHHLTADDLHTLLEVAMYRELQERGYSLSKMSLLLGSSPRRIRRFGEKSRRLQEVVLEPGTFRRILSALEAGPISAEQLGRLLHQESEFDVRSIALQLLRSQGLIEERGRPPIYRLSPAWARRDVAQWEKPLTELELRYALGLTLLRRLVDRPMTLLQIKADPRFKEVPEARLAAILSVLEQSGYLESQPIGAHRTPRYSVCARHLAILPDDPNTRLRVGLLDLFDKLDLFLDAVLERPGEVYHGQRNWLFQMRPEDLRTFAGEHRRWVLERLEALEARARVEGGGAWCVMSWMLSPLRSG